MEKELMDIFAEEIAKEAVREMLRDHQSGERNYINGVPNWGRIPLQFLKMFSKESMIEINLADLISASGCTEEDLKRNDVLEIALSIGWKKC